MSFGSAKPAAAAAAKPSLMQDIKQDGFFTGVGDYFKDRMGSHEEQVSMVEQHKIEAENAASEELLVREEIQDGIVNEETTAKPGLMEDIRHDGVFGGAMDFVKDHLPGHSEKPAAMYHQEFGEAAAPEVERALVETIHAEYVPSTVRPTRPLTQGTVLSAEKVTKEDLMMQGRFFELEPVRLPFVAEPSALTRAVAAAPAAVAKLPVTTAAPATMIGGTRTIPAAPVMAAAPIMTAAPTMMVQQPMQMQTVQTVQMPMTTTMVQPQPMAFSGAPAPSMAGRIV